MYGAGDEDSSLPIDDNGLPVVSDATLDQLENQKQHQEEQEQELGN